MRTDHELELVRFVQRGLAAYCDQASLEWDQAWVRWARQNANRPAGASIWAALSLTDDQQVGQPDRLLPDETGRVVLESYRSASLDLEVFGAHARAALLWLQAFGDSDDEIDTLGAAGIALVGFSGLAEGTTELGEGYVRSVNTTIEIAFVYSAQVTPPGGGTIESLEATGALGSVPIVVEAASGD